MIRTTLLCGLLSLASCSESDVLVTRCEFCGRAGGQQGEIQRLPNWLEESPFKRGVIASLGEVGVSVQELQSSRTSPQLFGELPPDGKRRVLAPTLSQDTPDSASWTWTVIGAEPWESTCVAPLVVTLSESVDEKSLSVGADYVWFITLRIDGQRQELGYVMRYSLSASPANGRTRGSVSQDELASEGYTLESLVSVTQAEMLIGPGESAILATIDGNTLRLQFGQNSDGDEPQLRQPWTARIKQRIDNPELDRVQFKPE